MRLRTPQDTKQLVDDRDGQNPLGSKDRPARRLVSVDTKRAPAGGRKLATQDRPRASAALDAASAQAGDAKVGGVGRSAARAQADVTIGDHAARRVSRALGDK